MLIKPFIQYVCVVLVINEGETLVQLFGCEYITGAKISNYD